MSQSSDAESDDGADVESVRQRLGKRKRHQRNVLLENGTLPLTLLTRI